MSNSVFPQESISTKNKERSTVTQPSPEIDYLGSVNRSLGTGKNAQDSVVWLTILWSFGIGIGTSFCLFAFVWYYYPTTPETCPDQVAIPEFPIEYISKIWSVFIPVITLALGYMFGKRKQ